MWVCVLVLLVCRFIHSCILYGVYIFCFLSVCVYECIGNINNALSLLIVWARSLVRSLASAHCIHRAIEQTIYIWLSRLLTSNSWTMAIVLRIHFTNVFSLYRQCMCMCGNDAYWCACVLALVCVHTCKYD